MYLLDLLFQNNASAILIGEKKLFFRFKTFFTSLFTPQPLRAVGVLFSPMVSGWAGVLAGGRIGGWREKVCPGCISETVRCRKLILGRDIG